MNTAVMYCSICCHEGPPKEERTVRSNVRRFSQENFAVWRCAHCHSLHCETVPDLASYYVGYPIRNQGLDYFLRAWYRTVLKRMVAAGLRKDHQILDFGCNQGLLIRFLTEQGYENVAGYDLYVERYNSQEVLERQYDFVISLDVLEHDEDPLKLMEKLQSMVKPGGRLCLETPNAEGIDLDDPEEYLPALHAPYHVHIFSEQALAEVSGRLGLSRLSTFNRWYMDSWWPATARGFFERLMKFGDNNVDSGYESPRIGLLLRHPSLLFHLLFGYLWPAGKTDHMMMILTR